MTQFDEKDLLKLAKLSRIECSAEEQKKLLHSLKNVLAYVEQLKEVDTEGAPLCSHVLETMVNVMRKDAVGEPLSGNLSLSNAPPHPGAMTRVPPVIKS